MSWNKVKLGTILTESKIETDKSDPDKRITVRLNLKGVEKRPYEAGIEGATKYFVRKAGQFIYGKQNLFKGAFGIIPKELDEYESSSDIPAFDINKNCLPEWLFYYLKQGDFYLSLESIATGTGSRRIQPARLFEIEIPLPSLKEQKEIIMKCSLSENNYDKIIEELKVQQTLLRQLRQAILQEAVQGKITTQNKKDEPADKLLLRIKAEKQKLFAAGKLKKEKELPPITKDEIPFELPKGWVWCRLNELGFITGGGTPSTGNTNYWNGNIPWITPKDMKADSLSDSEDKVTMEGIKNSSAKLIPANSILVVGRSGILKRILPVSINTVECTVNQDLKVLVPYLPEMSRYIQLMLQGHQDYILKNLIKYGMTVHSLMYQEFELQVFPIPPLLEQHCIVTKVQQLLKMTTELEQQITQSKTQAQQLLQAVLKEAFGSLTTSSVKAGGKAKD